MHDDGIDARHRQRMQQKKALVDGHIAAAARHTGVLVVNTGNGRGKSSSAFGMALRALGHGMKVGVVQFIKGAHPTGEELFLRRFPDLVGFHAMGEGYTWDTQDRQRDIAAAERGWQQARLFLADAGVGLVILDELSIVLKYRYLDVRRVVDDLNARPEMQHVVVTGRSAVPELLAAADTVTDMRPVKHAFAAGIAAQRGVEW